MKILFVSTEVLSVAKTGGLADAVFGLAREIRDLGHDVRFLIPYYHHVQENANYAHANYLTNLENVFPNIDVQILTANTALAGIPVYFIAHQIYSEHPDAGIYVNDANEVWEDNHIRFGILNKVAAMFTLENSGIGWTPDILHAHDWSSALAPVYVHLNNTSQVATVLTLHNLAFQGLFDSNVLPQLLLPHELWDSGELQLWDRLSWLKAGICFSNVVTTVSPSYRNQVLKGKQGMGLEECLRAFHPEMPGILLGVSKDIWNPQENNYIVQNFDVDNLAGKRACKKFLQEKYGLIQSRDSILISTVSRLAYQKMGDLLDDIARTILVKHPDAQFIFAGLGEPDVQAKLLELQQEYPGRVACVLEANERLFHQVYAGADIVVHGARWEPCGLSHRYAMLFGTVPVVSYVDGLIDAVCDPEVDGSLGLQNGFFAVEPTVNSMSIAILRALDCFENKAKWLEIQREIMTNSIGWSSAGIEYERLYEMLLEGISISRSAPVSTEV